MYRITDQDYFLPEIFALDKINNLDKGRNNPSLINGICKKSNKLSQYVVKYKNSKEMSIASSIFELIAAFIAMELDIEVVKPVIIDINEKFAESQINDSNYETIRKSIGINYGSEYIGGGFNILINFQNPIKNKIDLLARIFAFDAIISNPDRRKDKPNILSNGEKLVVLDHELAFAFARDIFPNNQPWLFNDLDKEIIKNHYFYNYLKGKNIKFTNFVDSLDKLNENFWKILIELIPIKWKNDEIEIIEKIQNHITSLNNNKEELNKQLELLIA